MMLNSKRNESPAAQAYGRLCPAPFHFRHFDELLADIGAKKTNRGNPLLEKFVFLNTKAYGDFLASAPQKKASW